MTPISLRSRLARCARRLRRDRSGLAMLEFAFSMPVVMVLGMYGVETANLALVNMKVSQIALNLADNASRVGLATGLTTEQLREVDLSDVLQAARYQGTGLKLTTYGRITLYSLEANSSGTQMLHWQRCLGKRGGTADPGYDSTYVTTYGTLNALDGTDTTAANQGVQQPLGMGDTGGAMVTAPASSGVIYVEINYQYQPVVGSWVMGSPRIHYIASFIVRDARDFTQIYNPAPAIAATAKLTCNYYTT